MAEAEWKQIMGNIYFLCASACYFQKDLVRVSEYFEMSERFAPEGSFFQSMGDNKYYGYEEFDDHMCFINDYHGAAEFQIKWIKHWGHKKAHPSAAIIYASYSNVLYEWNRLEEAETYINQVLRPHDTPLNTRSLLQIYVSASRIQQALGNTARAAELLEQVKLQIDSPDYELFLRKVEAEQACLAVRQGSMQDAVEWMERCGMAPTDEVSLNGVAERMALARVLAACGRAEEALSISERLHQLFCKEDRLRDRIKILILQSVTLYRIGQTEEALGMLETALRLAEPEGFIRSFIDEGPVMEEMLSVYLKAHQGGPARRNPSVDLDYVKALHVGQEESVKPVRAKIRCFGRFTVLAGSGDEIKWRTSKTEGLMAYLIHHRGEPLDKHRIMESLWGDVDAERALAQLNTTVHYLRKNLSQIGLEGIVHYSRGYYRIDMGPFDCDYNEFHRMVSAGVPIDSGNFQEYEEDLARVYQTGYMDGNDYPWAEQARSSLENEYVSTLLQIHEHYVQERNFPAAAKLLKKALACDPLNEGIHTKLIHVFMLAGNRSSAMKQYEYLRRMLHVEFGVEPRDTVKQLLQ